jgi:diaminohydroxyphosphoribosylaminopyrimidine deaminase/5-amino-6-(5-phosphoribosylamino)uracil reductase
MSQGLPFVRLKMATSLDGRTAMASGESQWITGPAARADVQRLRARSSAVVTGIDSLLLDDSRLNVRAEQPLRGAPADLPIRQPLRVVIDRTLKIPESAALFAEAGDILIASCNDDHRSPLFDNPAVTHWSFDECAGHLPLRALLERLAEERQVNELLVETGAGLAGAFMQQGLVDELVVYMAPMLMGSSARPMFDWPIANMADSRRWQLIDQRILGEDLRLTLRPKQEG